MQRRTACKLFAFGFAVMLVGGFIALFAFGQSKKWVGHTDLEVRFIVTDAETGRPVAHATIHIRAESGGFCDDPQSAKFTIKTDKNGHAKRLATNCECFGSRGTFEDTFGSHVPPWSFHASAAGYSATIPADLDVRKHARRVQRGGPFATLSVPIRLRRIAK